MDQNNPYKCLQCEARFPEINLIKEHYLAVHEKPEKDSTRASNLTESGNENVDTKIDIPKNVAAPSISIK